ncbi:MAG: hypothetical protein FJ291_33165, partial [Planctomycetes bacterium]|nr:hypothetical protein [Planctomycetota bacterium]
REVFEGFVADETTHMEKLLKARKASSLTVQQGSLSSLPRPRAVRLPADGLADAPAAYRFAIRAEKSAWALYSVLAQMAAEPRIRRTFEFLAAEEMSHRTKLEAGLKALKSSRGFFRGLIRLFRRS